MSEEFNDSPSSESGEERRGGMRGGARGPMDRGDRGGAPGGRFGARRGFAPGGTRRRKKTCPFCHGRESFDYKAADRLKRYLTDRGKIVPRRIAGTCARHQRTLTTLIKRARSMALLPYVGAFESRERR